MRGLEQLPAQRTGTESRAVSRASRTGSGTTGGLGAPWGRGSGGPWNRGTLVRTKGSSRRVVPDQQEQP